MKRMLATAVISAALLAPVAFAAPANATNGGGHAGRTTQAPATNGGGHAGR